MRWVEPGAPLPRAPRNAQGPHVGAHRRPPVITQIQDGQGQGPADESEQLLQLPEQVPLEVAARACAMV